MVTVKPSPYNACPVDVPLEVSKITKFQADHLEITVGIVDTPHQGRQIALIHWGYPAYATEYTLEPISFTVVDPVIAYLRFLRNLDTALDVNVLQYDYLQAQLWRQVYKWAIQMGFNLSVRTLQ